VTGAPLAPPPGAAPAPAAGPRQTLYGFPAGPAPAPAARAPAAGHAKMDRSDPAVELADLDVVEEELYTSEGSDYAMGFEGNERTSIGGPGAVPGAFDDGEYDAHGEPHDPTQYGGGKRPAAVESIDEDADIIDAIDALEDDRQRR